MPDDRETRLAELQARMRACRRCAEAGYLAEANPIAGSRGHARDRIMLIGQAPGRLSVERGMPFGGPGGVVLDRWLSQAGFPAGFLRAGVYLTALTRCFPGQHPAGHGDRAPSLAEMALCRPWLDAELDLIDPAVVLLVGGLAIRTFAGPGPLERWIGTWLERDGRLWLPLPHPSGVSRWLNAAAHQRLLEAALGHLSDWRAAQETTISG
jgi:uracil-DNA glycosylase family 4